MQRITLVCSTHRENGLCSSSELLRILRHIEPEIVFEEIRPDHFATFSSQGIDWSLEARAVSMYSEHRTIRRVPVDRYVMPGDLARVFKRALDKIFGITVQASIEYRLLDAECNKLTHENGFSYLNDRACELAMTRMAELEDEVINATGDRSLISWLQKWRELNLAREREMVRTIYEFCGGNAFEAAVFLVGAAHRTSIVEAVEELSRVETTPIEWKLHLPS